MRETKDQTIARLEKTNTELKSELTDVKKDRKRLNYAVERLEKEKLSAQSSKETPKRIKELKSQIEELKTEKAKYEAQLLAAPKTQCANKDNDKHVYRINISWVDKPDIDMAMIEKLEEFFTILGLERIDREDVKFPYHVEVTIEYRFKGSYDSFLQLKHCAMAVLDVIYKDNKVLIHGKRIEWL